MKIVKTIIALTAISILLYFGFKNVQAVSTDELTISAAASLKYPIEEITEQYEKKTGIKVHINLGGSGTLQKQIEEGAPVDLFISAGKSQVDALIDKGLADKSTYKELLTNSLVLIVLNKYDNNISSIDSLKDKDIKLVIGETTTVPVGQYSKDFLKNINLWSSFQNSIVYAKDVKAVLNYVEIGAAEAGIVYNSDAVDLKNSYIAYRIPPNTHKPIIYPLIVINESKHKVLAENFIDFMDSPQSKEIFEKYNFTVKDN